MNDNKTAAKPVNKPTAVPAAPAAAKTDKAGDKPTEKRAPRTAEEKASKFKELAVKRTNKVLKSIAGLGNLSSSNYAYTEEQAAKMIAALKGAVAELETRFAKTHKAEKPAFDL